MAYHCDQIAQLLIAGHVSYFCQCAHVMFYQQALINVSTLASCNSLSMVLCMCLVASIYITCLTNNNKMIGIYGDWNNPTYCPRIGGQAQFMVQFMLRVEPAQVRSFGKQRFN